MTGRHDRPQSGPHSALTSTGVPSAALMTIILGMVGVVAGGFLAGAFLKFRDPTGINIETIVVSVIGAIIVVFAANLLMGSVDRRRSA